MPNFKKRFKLIKDAFKIKRPFATKTKELKADDDDIILKEIKTFAEIAKEFQNLNNKLAKESNNSESKKFFIKLEKFSRKVKDEIKKIFKKIESAEKLNKDTGELIKQYAHIRNQFFKCFTELSEKSPEDNVKKLICDIHDNIKSQTDCNEDTYKMIKTLNDILKRTKQF